jgi:ketosteroid isomerase-like protein
MTNEEVATFIARHTDAWNRRDPAALSSHHTPAGVVVSPMFHRVDGRADIRRSY